MSQCHCASHFKYHFRNEVTESLPRITLERYCITINIKQEGTLDFPPMKLPLPKKCLQNSERSRVSESLEDVENRNSTFR